MDKKFDWPFSPPAHKRPQHHLFGMGRLTGYDMHLSTNDIAQPVNFSYPPRAKALDLPENSAFDLVNP